MQRKLVIKEEDCLRCPDVGYRTLLTSYRWEDAHHSHGAVVEVYDQATSFIVLSEFYPNYSQARERLFELTRQDLLI